MKVIKPLTFSNFEFERASSATYYNSSGVLSVAAVDVLRESYNPNTLAYEGPIFENAATNLVPYSNDFSEWTPFNSATGIGVQTPPVNPDASLPVQFMQSLGTSAWQVYQDVGALSGLYTFSIFTKVKTPQAGTLSEVTISVLGGAFLGYTRFNINAAAPAVLSANRVISNSIQQINNGWLRLSITVNLPFDGVSRRLNIYGGAPAGGSDGKGFHYLWVAQLAEEKPLTGVLPLKTQPVLAGEANPELPEPLVVSAAGGGPLYAGVVGVGGLILDGVAVAVQVVHGGKDLRAFQRHLGDVDVGVHAGGDGGGTVQNEDVHGRFILLVTV